MPFRKFEDIAAWQTAREIAKVVYEVSNTAQFSRDFGLRDHLRKSAISVMANIAEGFARRSEREFGQFLFIAKGSATELMSHLYVALDQGYLTEQTFARVRDRVDHCARQLSNLIRYLVGGRSARSKRPALP